MRICETCGAEFEPPQQQVMCPACYWTGAYLQESMAPVIAVLEKATGTEWNAYHTGGGCFCLETRVDWEPGAEDGPIITVTEYPDIMSGIATPASIEEERGYYLGANLTWDGETGRYWPEDYTLEYGLHAEELPMLVREALAWLRTRVREEG